MLCFRNNDSVNRRLKLLPLDSPNFTISGPRSPHKLKALKQTKVNKNKITRNRYEGKHKRADSNGNYCMLVKRLRQYKESERYGSWSSEYDGRGGLRMGPPKLAKNKSTILGVTTPNRAHSKRTRLKLEKASATVFAAAKRHTKPILTCSWQHLELGRGKR